MEYQSQKYHKSALSNEVCNFGLAQGAQKLSAEVDIQSTFTMETTHLNFDGSFKNK